MFDKALSSEAKVAIDRNLTVFLLFRCIHITDVGIAAIACGCPDLETMNTAYCDKVTNTSLESLSKCLKLKALEIRGCPGVSSVGLSAIAQRCRQLIMLDIKKCHNIKDTGMLPLAQFSQNLKQVTLISHILLVGVLKVTLDQ